MSLINEMLRDLESGRPDDLARQNLQREIRTLPAARRSQRWPLAVFAVVVLGGGLGSIVWLQQQGHLPGWPGASSAPPVVPSVASTPPAPPVVAVDVPAAPISENLKMALELASTPVVAEPPPLVPDPVVPSPGAAPNNPQPPLAVPSAKVVTPPVPVAANPPSSVPAQPDVAATPVRIEKSPVLATPRDRAEADYRKADALRIAGHHEEALALYQSALKTDPSYAPPRQGLLRILLETRRLPEAIAALQQGLEIQPAQTGWAMSLARLQLEQGEVAAADATLTRTQRYAEGNADYAGFQGHVKSRLGLPREAAAHYLRATRLAPGEGRWWLGLGLALELSGQRTEAKEALRQAIQTATLNPQLTAVAEQHLR